MHRGGALDPSEPFIGIGRAHETHRRVRAEMDEKTVRSGQCGRCRPCRGGVRSSRPRGQRGAGLRAGRRREDERNPQRPGDNGRPHGDLSAGGGAEGVGAPGDGDAGEDGGAAEGGAVGEGAGARGGVSSAGTGVEGNGGAPGHPFFFGSLDALPATSGHASSPIEHAVAVRVVLRAAVGVLDSVPVFGQVGAFVLVVGHAIVVAVPRARRPLHGEHRPEGRDADGRVEAGLGADEQIRVAIVAERDAIVGDDERGREDRRSVREGCHGAAGSQPWAATSHSCRSPESSAAPNTLGRTTMPMAHGMALPNMMLSAVPTGQPRCAPRTE